MNHTNEKRDTPILIKVTPQEKDQIAKNANAFGGSVSDFIRHQSLHPDKDSATGAKMQTIVHELCRLYELIKNPNTDQLRRNLEEWSESIWQFMK